MLFVCIIYDIADCSAHILLNMQPFGAIQLRLLTGSYFVIPPCFILLQRLCSKNQCCCCFLVLWSDNFLLGLFPHYTVLSRWFGHHLCSRQPHCCSSYNCVHTSMCLSRCILVKVPLLKYAAILFSIFVFFSDH